MTRLFNIFCIGAIFFLMGFNLYADSVYSYGVYSYDLKKDIAISTVSLGLALTGLLMDNEPSIPASLKRDDVNGFDRRFMYSHNETLHNLRDISRIIIPIIPIISPLSVWGSDGWEFERKDFDTWLTYSIMYSQAIALTLGTVFTTRKIVDRYRPRSYFENNIDTPISNDSFPSDTTAISFLAATFLSITFSAENQDSQWKMPVYIGSYALAASIGAIGVLSGMHFLSDVIVAAAIGTIYGWLIPALHKKNDNGIALHLSGNGILLSYKY